MAAMVKGRTIKRGGFIAVVAAVALGASQIVASADTLTAIGIDCGDGYPISATVDAPTLTKVQSAIQAMVNFPAGLSCSLTTSALTAPSLTTTTSTTSTSTTTTSTNGDAFVTGGGQYQVGTCNRNFGLSAKPDKNSTTRFAAHGTSNVTETSDNGCPQGHVSSSVLCLVVGTDSSGNGIAQIKSTVTHVDGFFTASPFLGAAGQVIETDVTDGANGAPDQIVHFFQGNGPPISGTCDVPSGGSHVVTHGNIKIHNS
jgi:hypothetical protein